MPGTTNFAFRSLSHSSRVDFAYPQDIRAGYRKHPSDSCAAFGGLPKAEPNPAGAVSVEDLLTDRPIVNVIAYMVRKAREGMLASGNSPVDVQAAAIRAVTIGSPMGIKLKALETQIRRIEGPQRIEAQMDGDRIGQAFSSGTMVGGFETILKGRDPRDAWAYAQRFCGVCANAGPRDAQGQAGAYEAALQDNRTLLDSSKPLQILRTIHSFDPCIACAVHLSGEAGQEFLNIQVTG